MVVAHPPTAIVICDYVLVRYEAAVYYRRIAVIVVHAATSTAALVSGCVLGKGAADNCGASAVIVHSASTVVGAALIAVGIAGGDGEAVKHSCRGGSTAGYNVVAVVVSR